MIFKIHNLFKSKFVTVVLVEKYRSWSLYNSVRILVASDYQLVTLYIYFFKKAPSLYKFTVFNKHLVLQSWTIYQTLFRKKCCESEFAKL